MPLPIVPAPQIQIVWCMVNRLCRLTNVKLDQCNLGGRSVFIFALLNQYVMSELENTGGRSPGESQQPGIFVTKIPSAVTFGVGILLFFMPFVDIKCNSITLQKVTGLELATGFAIEGPGSDKTVIGDFERMDDKKVEAHIGEEKNDPNIFMLVALALGVVAFVLTFFEGKRIRTAGVIAGALSVAAVVGAMIDIKRKVQVEIPEIINSSANWSKAKNDMYISVDFTAWIYIATLAFIVATWFCYRRMQATK